MQSYSAFELHMCKNSFFAYELSKNLRRKDPGLVFWQNVEIQLFRKWRRALAYVSGNEESSSVGSRVAAFVLRAEVWDHCDEKICTA